MIEISAGKLNIDGKLVTPDKRKGTIQVFKGEDELIHFCWKERANANLLKRKGDSNEEFEDDWILFPGDAKLVKVEQSNDRVYLLKFESGMRKFYWMQDSDPSKDEENVKKINEFINQPLQDVEMASVSTEDENPIPTEQQVTSSSKGKVTLDFLQSAINKASSSKKSFSSVLTIGNLQPILSDENVLKDLFPLLPENAPKTKSEIESIIRSPQFMQAVSILDEAASNGEIKILLHQFGIESKGQNVEDVINAIRKKNSK